MDQAKKIAMEAYGASICDHYGVDPNAKVQTLFTYDPRKWYGPLHRYNRLITIRNHRVELGLRLSYGK